MPTVKEDGSTAYTAEAGDSAKTMSSQYGISQSDAEAITGTTGNTEIAAGTEISDESVKNVTGSDVLKLDLNSKLATDQRVFDQFVFAADHSKSLGKGGFFTTEYYGNVFNQSNRIKQGFATLSLNGKNIPISFHLPLYDTQGVFRNVKYYAYYLVNYQITDNHRYGNVFGQLQELNHTLFELYLPLGKDGDLRRQREYRIISPYKNINDIRQKFKSN